MAQYIDKSALIAKLEKRIEETKGMQPKFDQFWAGQISAFKGVLKILDTLEVKEVGEPSKNLEEAASQYPSVIRTISPQWESEIERAFKAGAQWQKEKTIKMAQDWLTDNYDKYIITNGLATMFKATIDFDTIKMVEDFKNYMNK